MSLTGAQSPRPATVLYGNRVRSRTDRSTTFARRTTSRREPRHRRPTTLGRQPIRSLSASLSPVAGRPTRCQASPAGCPADPHVSAFRPPESSGPLGRRPATIFLFDRPNAPCRHDAAPLVRHPRLPSAAPHGAAQALLFSDGTELAFRRRIPSPRALPRARPTLQGTRPPVNARVPPCVPRRRPGSPSAQRAARICHCRQPRGSDRSQAPPPARMHCAYGARRARPTPPYALCIRIPPSAFRRSSPTSTATAQPASRPARRPSRASWRCTSATPAPAPPPAPRRDFG